MVLTTQIGQHWLLLYDGICHKWLQNDTKTIEKTLEMTLMKLNTLISLREMVRYPLLNVLGLCWLNCSSVLGLLSDSHCFQQLIIVLAQIAVTTTSQAVHCYIDASNQSFTLIFVLFYFHFDAIFHVFPIFIFIYLLLWQCFPLAIDFIIDS